MAQTNVTSRLEWLSTLSPIAAAKSAQFTEETRFQRKVCAIRL